MAKSIDQAYINTYESNLRHLAQQSTTRLRPFVQNVYEESEAHNWETLAAFGDGDIRTKTGGLSDTPDNDEVWAKRRTNLATFDTGNSVQLEDPIQMLVDPNSNITRAQAMLMARKIDDVIIDGAFKDAPIKGAGTPVAFPAGQVVGDGTTSISFDLITEVTEKFLENDIDPAEPKVWIIGPKQARKLLQLTEATSSDYTLVRPLQDKGIIEHWMGYKWIVSTRLQAPAAGEIDSIVMTERALGLQVGCDIKTQVAQDPSKSFAWRIYSHMSMDCVRVEDQQIVRAHLLDAV